VLIIHNLSPSFHEIYQCLYLPLSSPPRMSIVLKSLLTNPHISCFLLHLCTPKATQAYVYHAVLFLILDPSFISSLRVRLTSFRSRFNKQPYRFQKIGDSTMVSNSSADIDVQSHDKRFTTSLSAVITRLITDYRPNLGLEISNSSIPKNNSVHT